MTVRIIAAATASTLVPCGLLYWCARRVLAPTVWRCQVCGGITDRDGHEPGPDNPMIVGHHVCPDCAKPDPA